MSSDNGAPILMYHAVGLPVATKTDTFLNIPAASFRRQMHALASLGFRARSFADIVDAWRSGLTLPRRTFAVTFDDAYCCVQSTAAPILTEFGMIATTFAVSTWIGASSTTGIESGRLNAEVMDAAGLQALMAQGWEVGGHTATHPHLDDLHDKDALNEIVAGKLEIEERLGTVLRTFCYPFGHINAVTPCLVRDAGFLGACTVRSGVASPTQDMYRLPRVKIGYRDGVTGLLYRLLVRPMLPTMRQQRRSHKTT